MALLLGKTLFGCLGLSEPAVPGDTQKTHLPTGKLGYQAPSSLLFTVPGAAKVSGSPQGLVFCNSSPCPSSLPPYFCEVGSGLQNEV